MTSNQRGETFASVQVARAIAATVVVFHHLEWAVGPTSAVVKSTPEWLSFGYAGVDIFFVISGFIIALVVSQGSNSPRTFILRRANRILPMYWAFTIAWIVLAWAGTHEAPTASKLIASMLVLPQRDLPILGVGWSLEHEFIFYGLVAILLFAKRLSLLVPVLCALTIGAFGLQIVSTGNPPWDLHLFSPYWFDFLLGVALFKLRAAVSKINPWLLIGTGTAILMFGNFASNQAFGGHVPTMPMGSHGIVRVVTLGMAGFMLISGGLALERQKPAIFDNALGRTLVEVGNSSYVLYLCHPLILKVMGAALSHRVPAAAVAQYSYALLAVAICLVAAAVISRSVEMPLVKALNRPRFGNHG